MKTTAEQPSWLEGYTVAGKALFHATLPLKDLTDRDTFGLTAASNGENMIRLLEGLIRVFIEMRDDLKANDLKKKYQRFTMTRLSTGRAGWRSGGNLISQRKWPPVFQTRLKR